jgi:hypothetical protein
LKIGIFFEGLVAFCVIWFFYKSMTRVKAANFLTCPCYSAGLFSFLAVFMIRFASIGKLITLLDFTLIQQPENTRQIKFLFKQLKQNFPIKFFLGGHENAIKIQIWSAQAVNLLLTVIRKKAKCKWGGQSCRFLWIAFVQSF